MRYPIGIQNFEKIIQGNFCYVDKTDLVYELAQKNVCFLSRPRKFGKSLLISTLDAYFSGKKELFKGLKMEELEQDWENYPVFKIDFAVGDYNNPKALDDMLNNCLEDWEMKYNIDNKRDTPGVRFLNIIRKAEVQTDHRAVVLIDEYDKPILDVLGIDMEEKLLLAYQYSQVSISLRISVCLKGWTVYVESLRKSCMAVLQNP